MAVLDLGKVRVTFEGKFDPNKSYEILSVVYNDYGVKYISVKDVPKDSSLGDRNYWVTITGDFVEQYQGAKDSDPDKRNDGNDLQKGDLYFNTTDNVMRIYKDDTAKWIDSYANVPDNFQSMTSDDIKAFKLKNNINVDKDVTIDSDDVVLCYNLTVKDDHTLTANGILVDLSKE